MSSSKTAKAAISGSKEPKGSSRKSQGELTRKPSSSALVTSERAMSVAGTGRKLSVATHQGGTTGRKLSTVKCRHPSGPRKTSSTERLSMHAAGNHQSGPGPGRGTASVTGASSSVVGFRQLLVTKRLARNLKLRTTQRLAEKRGLSCVTYTDRPRRPAGRSSQEDSATVVEPTYQLEPSQRFGEFKGAIAKVLDDLIAGRLAKLHYDPRLCSGQAKLLSGDIQERVKDLGLERYKLITVVHVGEIQQQTVRVCSRGIWDTSFDSFVTYEYQNASLYCVATVFGIYHE